MKFTDFSQLAPYASQHRVADLPEKPKKIKIKAAEPEPEQTPEVKPKTYKPFICTKCGQGVESVTVVYRKDGVDLIPTGEQYCRGCFGKSKMVSLNSISERRIAREEVKPYPKPMSMRNLRKISE